MKILTAALGEVDTDVRPQDMTSEEIDLEIKALNQEITDIVTVELDDSKVPRELKVQIDGMHQRAADLEHHLLETKGLQGIREAALARDLRMDFRIRGANGYVIPLESEGRRRRQEVKSVADQLFSNRDFTGWVEHNKRTVMMEGSHFSSPAFEVKAVVTGLSDTSAGAMVPHEYSGIVDMGTTMRPLVMRDLMTQLRTTRDAVDFVRTTFTNNAVETLEAVSTVTGAKPQSDLAFALVPVLIESIPHWFAATRRAIADAKELKDIINKLGMYGLEERVDRQIILGDGVTPNLLGLDAALTAAGVATQAFVTDIKTSIRKGITRVSVDGKARTTAIVLSPGDLETVELQASVGQGLYYASGPTGYGSAISRLWGLPLVENQALLDGFGYVGDWRLGVIWNRENASMRMTDSHSDFFVRNILVLLFEERLGLGWIRPQAFKKVDTAA